MAVTILSFVYTLITVGLLYFFLNKSLTRDFPLRKNIPWWILFGFVFNFCSFTWLYTVYPLIWIPTGVLQIIGIAIIHLTVSILVGLCFCIVGYILTNSSSKKITSIYRPFLFAASLTLAEVFRSLMLSLIFYGNDGSINLHFTSGTLGNALSSTPLIEFAYFGGTFALTFLLGYLVYSFSSYSHMKTYWKHVAIIVAILVGIHVFVPIYGPTQKTVVGIVTTHFKTQSDNYLVSSFKEQNIKVDAMTQSFFISSRDIPDIIVYPEDTRYIDHLSNEKVSLLSTTFPKTLFVDGSTRIIDGKRVNISFFYNSETRKTLGRGKSFLLPFNEYIPLFFKPIFGFFIPKEEMGEYSANHTYTPVYSGKTIFFNGMHIGTLLCSEILSFKTIADVKKEKPSLVFFQSHLNVFHDNSLFRMHLYSFTKIAAAQLRRPLISSTNGAPSLIVSPYGVIIEIIPTGFSTSTHVFSSPSQ